MDNPLIGARSQIIIAERQEGFLVLPADANIHECRLGSSASVEATSPVFVADVTLVLAIFSDFRFKSRLSLLHNVGDQAIRSSSRIVIMLDRRLLLVWCMYLICVPNLRT